MSDKDKIHSNAWAQPGRQGFLPGNPGKLKGTKNKVSIETLRNIQSLREAALIVLEQKLAQGSMEAAAFVLQRCTVKSAPIELDDLDAEALRDIASSGAVTTDDLKSLASTVEKLRKVEEIDTLRDRIAQLEKLLDARMN